MNTCIKTGALVYMPAYDLACAADLFEICGCIIVRFPGNPEEKGKFFDQMPCDTTHIVYLDPPDMTWVRFDLGIVAVPADFVISLPRVPRTQP